MRIFCIPFIFPLLFTCVTQAQSLTLLKEFQTASEFHAGFGYTGGSDCFGWTDASGNDYGLYGSLYGMHIFRSSDQKLLDSVAGPELMDLYYHRDIKVYKNYAYMTGEMKGVNEGLVIVDLKYLPDSVHYVRSWKTSNQITSHNLSIDTANGYLYILDSKYDGAKILDIHTDPENPDSVGFVVTGDIHDVFARNDTAWIAEGWQSAYSVWDCSDKSNPQLITRISDPAFGYAHNIWPSDNGQFFATAEETPNRTVKMWDMSDPGNVTLHGEYLASCDLAHNVHVMGDYLFISHYESGITVVDWTVPGTMPEVAAFDTYAASDTSEFHGCWGAFPFTQNGYVYASNMDGRFFILRWTSVGTDDPSGLMQNVTVSPNPFSNTAALHFSLEKPAEVAVRLLDLTGKEVLAMPRKTFAAGEQHFAFEASVAPGMYLLEVNAGGQRHSERVCILR